MKKKEVSLKGTLELSEVVAYLEDLIGCLKEGTVCIKNCDDFVALAPSPQIKLEVSAEQRDAKESISLKLVWHKSEHADRRMALSISSEIPEAKEEGDEDEQRAEEGPPRPSAAGITESDT